MKMHFSLCTGDTEKELREIRQAVPRAKILHCTAFSTEAAKNSYIVEGGAKELRAVFDLARRYGQIYIDVITRNNRAGRLICHNAKYIPVGRWQEIDISFAVCLSDYTAHAGKCYAAI